MCNTIKPHDMISAISTMSAIEGDNAANLTARRSSSRVRNLRLSSPQQPLKKYKDFFCEEEGSDEHTYTDNYGGYEPSSGKSRNTTSRNKKKRSNVSKANKIYHESSNALFTSLDSIIASRKVQANGVVEPFPLKLHAMLRGTQRTGHDHIVSWCSHGRCFIVHNPSKFVSDVMPTYFRQSKFPSFQRQLNLYGFKRITQGPDKNGYYHPRFLRGKPELTECMMRMKVKGTGVRRPTKADEEPNFYKMPPIEEYDFASTGICSTNNNADSEQLMEKDKDTEGDKGREPAVTDVTSTDASDSRSSGSSRRSKSGPSPSPLRGKKLTIKLQQLYHGSNSKVPRPSSAGHGTSSTNRIDTPAPVLITAPTTPDGLSEPSASSLNEMGVSSGRQLDLMDALDYALLIGSQVLPEQQQLQHATAGNSSEMHQLKSWPAASCLPASPLEPPPIDASSVSTSSSTSYSSDSSLDKDLLFFEGRPFHYLPSMD